MKRYFIFVMVMVVLSLGAFLRFYHLAEVPISLSEDEAAFGYNAYSILKTGRDEHGQFLPWVFKSFGDYKPPILVYILVPFISIMGLTEQSIRLPIALVSTLLLILIYLVSKQFFDSRWTAILAMFFTAISMWAIQFSRAAWEASLALFFTTLAIYLFFKGLKKERWLIFSGLTFTLAFYSYHAEKVAIPLLIVILVLLYRKHFKWSKTKILLWMMAAFIVALPALVAITNFSGQSRARGTLVSDYFFQSTKEPAYILTNSLLAEPSWNQFVSHSSFVLGLSDIASKFYAYLSPANIFVYGDVVGRHGVEDFGVLYNFEFILLLITTYFFIKKPKTKFDYFLLAWLVIGALPAMITKDRLHVIRPLVALPALYILEGWGVWQLYLRINKLGRTVSIISLFLFFLVVVMNLVRFSHSYFIYTPIERAFWWQHGTKELVEVVKNEQDRFQTVIIEMLDEYPMVYGNPYIFFLLYQRYDPLLYNQTVVRENDIKNKTVPVYSFGKYQFRKIYWPQDKSLSNTLFVGTEESLPRSETTDITKYRLIKEISLPTGKLLFRVVETL